MVTTLQLKLSCNFAIYMYFIPAVSVCLQALGTWHKNTSDFKPSKSLHGNRLTILHKLIVLTFFINVVFNF